MSAVDIEEARKWIRLHERNKYQREAARRMTSLVDEIERVRAERDELRAVVERVQSVLDSEHHADTCDQVLTPDAGYPCTCWKAALSALLPGTNDDERSDP